MTQHLDKVVAVGSSVLTVVAPKFCCWGSAIGAMSSGVSYLAWVYPLRPYLWGISFIMLGFSFYRVYKSSGVHAESGNSCNNCSQEKPTFLQTKSFTWITAIVVVLVFIITYFQ